MLNFNKKIRSSRKKQKRSCGKQHGGALILVLVLLSTMGVLAASSAAISLYLSVGGTAALTQSRNCYYAESAMNRVLFYLREDAAAHADRTLGENEYHGINDFYADAERWLADGIQRTVEISSDAIV